MSYEKDVQTDEDEGDEYLKKEVFVLTLQKKVMNVKDLYLAEGHDGSH